MIIKTSDINSIKPFIDKLNFPRSNSHKGQNGKLLIIGGSSLFHAASLWSAAIASRIVDIVHYSSTEENEKIFLNLKTKFVDGIIVKKKDLEHYLEEDDCILLGPGMIRGKICREALQCVSIIDDIFSIQDEPYFTYYLTQFLIKHYSHKKFVFDAGSLQIMEKDWLLLLKEKPILTPHQVEFKMLFGENINDKLISEKKKIVKKTAEKYNCIIILKAVNDIISDGSRVVEIVGGNAGLTKGGTGDVLAGLISALNTKNDQFVSAITASFLLKKSAEKLFKKKHFWYNTSDLISEIPFVFKSVTT